MFLTRLKQWLFPVKRPYKTKFTIFGTTLITQFNKNDVKLSQTFSWDDIVEKDTFFPNGNLQTHERITGNKKRTFDTYDVSGFKKKSVIEDFENKEKCFFFYDSNNNMVMSFVENENGSVTTYYKNNIKTKTCHTDKNGKKTTYEYYPDGKTVKLKGIYETGLDGYFKIYGFSPKGKLSSYRTGIFEAVIRYITFNENQKVKKDTRLDKENKETLIVRRRKNKNTTVFTKTTGSFVLDGNIYEDMPCIIKKHHSADFDKIFSLGHIQVIQHFKENVCTGLTTVEKGKNGIIFTNEYDVYGRKTLKRIRKRGTIKEYAFNPENGAFISKRTANLDRSGRIVLGRTIKYSDNTKLSETNRQNTTGFEIEHYQKPDVIRDKEIIIDRKAFSQKVQDILSQYRQKTIERQRVID